MTCVKFEDVFDMPKDCTITMADADLMAMAEGKLDGMQALHGWQAEDQGQHDAGAEVAVPFWRLPSEEIFEDG